MIWTWVKKQNYVVLYVLIFGSVQKVLTQSKAILDLQKDQVLDLETKSSMKKMKIFPAFGDGINNSLFSLNNNFAQLIVI